MMSLMLGTGVVFAKDEQGKAGKGKGPCAADVQKFCKGVKKGEGRIIACLKSQQSELSQACSAKFKKGPEGKPSEGEDEE